MRVLELTQRFPPAIGGVEEHVFQLASRLHTSSVDIEVLTTDLLSDNPFSRLPNDGSSFPFPVFRARAWKLAEAPHGTGIVSPSMFHLALTRRAQVVHAHAYGYFPMVVGSAARLLRTSALVATPHSDPGRGGWSKRAFDRLVPTFTLRRASRVIALTRREGSYLQSIGIAEERIRIIPNGVNIQEFEPASPQSRPLTRLLFVGRLYPAQKGLDPLVRALALVPRSTSIQLRLVGEDWGGAAVVRALAARLGVADRVVVLGKLDRPSLLREYALADIFVLPSLFEPFGIVLLEAMAAGLPLIASRVGGIPEIVADGRNGLLVEPNQPVGLAEAIRRLCEDEHLRRSMGREGRERVRAYSWDSIAKQTKAVYVEALEEAAR